MSLRDELEILRNSQREIDRIENTRKRVDSTKLIQSIEKDLKKAAKRGSRRVMYYSHFYPEVESYFNKQGLTVFTNSEGTIFLF